MLLWVGAIASLASAQDRGLRVHRDEAATPGANQLLVDRPWYSATHHIAVGLSTQYTLAPLRPALATGRTDASPILTGALLGSVDVAGALFDRLLLTASLPVTLLESGRVELVSGVGPDAAPSLGNPRLGVMLRVFGQAERSPVSLHLGADAWLPTPVVSSHQGDGTLRFAPRLVLAGAGGAFRWAFEAGFLFRGYSSLGPPALGLTAASEARAGLSLGLSLFGDRLSIGPEARGAMQVLGAQALTPGGASLEVLGGAHLRLFDAVVVGVGGGAGFFGAPGTPDARALLRLAWAPRASPGDAPPAAAPRPAPGEAPPTSAPRPGPGEAPPTSAPRPGPGEAPPTSAPRPGPG
ncbi:MAG: hypothetical protein INH41_07120, partial [Myxococcaceae bacterium]|nr:hypothetical protein [Myxococcaceae bacterium]